MNIMNVNENGVISLMEWTVKELAFKSGHQLVAVLERPEQEAWLDVKEEAERYIDAAQVFLNYKVSEEDKKKLLDFAAKELHSWYFDEDGDPYREEE